MFNESIINNIGPQGSTGPYGSIGLSKVHADRIDLPSLRKELFPIPKVIEEPPPTIDQMCTAALSRLRVSIEANANWELIQFHRRCRNYELKYRIHNTVFTNAKRLYLDTNGFVFNSDKYLKS